MTDQLTDQQKRARDKLYIWYVRNGMNDDLAFSKATFDVKGQTVNYYERTLSHIKD